MIKKGGIKGSIDNTSQGKVVKPRARPTTGTKKNDNSYSNVAFLAWIELLSSRIEKEIKQHAKEHTRLVNQHAQQQIEDLRMLVEVIKSSNKGGGDPMNIMVNILAQENVSMRDAYRVNGGNVMNNDTINISEISGQVAAIGTNVHAHGNIFNQWMESKGNSSLDELAKDLSSLRAALKENATEPEHDVTVGTVAGAQAAAQKGDGAKTFEYLSKAGNWALDVATKIGASLAAEAIKRSMM
ncbi:MAG: hypothetical protein HOP19_01450 [Acidobacteria bacterium]|nr:hypothetical protein [Acidobacteriota bacterium]